VLRVGPGQQQIQVETAPASRTLRRAIAPELPEHFGRHRRIERIDSQDRAQGAPTSRGADDGNGRLATAGRAHVGHASELVGAPCSRQC
jgi:hypothetical protein